MARWLLSRPGRLVLRGIAWAAGQNPYRFDPLVMFGASVK
jgi:hypothetical protein